MIKTESSESILTIEEFGFTGSDEEIAERVIGSSKVFNQVIVAAKAMIGHGIAINIVADHA